MEKALQRQKDKQEKEKTRRELLGKLFFDFAKLVFAAFVLGGLSPLFQGKAEGEVSVPASHYRGDIRNLRQHNIRIDRK